MKLTICAIFRREALYLREWIEFHLMMGFEHFYLFNHRSEDHYLSVLQPYIDRGIVDLTDYPFAHPCQEQAYRECIARVRGRQEWMAVLDIDEFLWSPRYDTVSEAIEALPLPAAWGAICVSWMCFGGGGQADWSDAPVIERFVWRPNVDLKWNRWMKCILNIAVENEIQVIPGDGHNWNSISGTFNENGARIVGPTMDPTSQLLRINHYYTKSRREWEIRHPADEPNCGCFHRDEDRWVTVQNLDVEDREIQRFLPKLKERLAK